MSKVAKSAVWGMFERWEGAACTCFDFRTPTLLYVIFITLKSLGCSYSTHFFPSPPRPLVVWFF
jgi:hypothetical protein